MSYDLLDSNSVEAVDLVKALGIKNLVKDFSFELSAGHLAVVNTTEYVPASITRNFELISKKYNLIEKSRLDELLEIEAMYKGLQK